MPKSESESIPPMNDRFRPPMIQSDLFTPSTLGRCDFFTATGDFTDMSVAISLIYSDFWRFLRVGCHGPRPLESKRIDSGAESPESESIFSTESESESIPNGHALLESESESGPAFWSGIGIDSSQLESSTSLMIASLVAIISP